MEAKATLRYARVAPNKARQVIANIRDLHVDEARELLALEVKAVAGDIGKVLNSAVANAENNQGLDPDELFVTAATVDEGPVLRRFRPRAMGRATRIRKRTSHITVVVGDGEEEPVAVTTAEAAETAPEGAGGSDSPEGEE